VSEGDESETKAAAPAAPRRKKRKRKKREPTAAERVVGLIEDPVGAVVGEAGAVAVDAIPKSPFFAPQRFVVAGGLATVVGLGLVGTGPSDVGRALWIGGVLVLVVGIHLLGRLGPDTGAG
jgi:hypothetical protein